MTRMKIKDMEMKTMESTGKKSSKNSIYPRISNLASSISWGHVEPKTVNMYILTALKFQRSIVSSLCLE